MDKDQRKELLGRVDLGQDFIDEIVEADSQAEKAGVTDELVRRTVDSVGRSSYTGKDERSESIFSRWYGKIAKYF